MLEDALKRDTVRAKNVGWGRQPTTASLTEDDARSARSLDAERPLTPGQPTNISPTLHTAQEGRFFKFRFGSTTPNSSGFSTPNGVHPSHLSSASLSSLSASKDEEIEKLTLELEKQKKERRSALEEKKKLEDELESLSQALFEEVCAWLSQGGARRALIDVIVTQANKMVAQERMKVADLEEELRERASEREALKLAMKILEEENQRFRAVLASAPQAVRQARATPPPRRLSPSPSRSHSRQSSNSSLTIPIVRHTLESPYASPQYMTPTESSPWGGGTTRAEKTPTTADPAQDKTTQPEKAARSLPPPLEVDHWADSPNIAPGRMPAPPETAGPDRGVSAIRSFT